MERRLAAILAADVVGYTRLMGEDEMRTLTALREIRGSVLEPQIAERNGSVLKRMGDGWFVEFPNVTAAAECAVSIQEQLRGHPLIRYRMGVHVGDIVTADEDIYGDGLNVASRLETLARPGQVLISDLVRYAMDQSAAARFTGGEAHSLKNVIRKVCVWRWPADSEVPAPPSAGDGTAVSYRDNRPSLVVLPFQHAPGDAEQEFFADGITEDIITELSRFRDLFVIARSTAISFKGRNADCRAIARELGVRYAVEGSVRKAANRVRVTVNLIDAESGANLWGDRYDRVFDDILDLQDELTRSIVATLPGQLRMPEEERLRRTPPGDMAAYDCLLAGKIHHHRVTREDNAKALEYLDRAVSLDPDFQQAWAWKACTLGQAFDYEFHDDPGEIAAAFEKTLYTALALDENDAECHRLLCEVSMHFLELGAAKTHADRAIALNPNDPRIVAQQGEVLAWLGRPEEGLYWLEMAVRLDPLNENERAHLLGRAYYQCGRYAEAAQAFARRRKPRRGHQAEAAAACALAGQADAARRYADEQLVQWPKFRISRYLPRLPFADPAHGEHLARGMRAAGLPE